MLALFLISQARPLVNPNTEGNKKNQSLSSLSALDKVVPVDLPRPPSPWSNNHEMNTSGDGQSVQGEAVPLDKSPVPPSAPSPITVGDANGIGNHDEMSTSGDDQSVQGEAVPLDKSPVPPSAPSPCTVGDANGIGNQDEMSGGECPVGA